MDNRIKFARYLNGWKYNTGDKSELKLKAQKILVTEYQPVMKDHIFCPHCCVGLFKSPKDKDFSSNGKPAFFSHKPGFDTVCDLRSKQNEGKHYLNEEDAKQAIQNDELVIVAGFIKDKPILPDINNSLYDQTEIEDITGPETFVPIGRHKGESFKLPSRFKTVKGIVTNFEENLHRYFHFPNKRNAILLQDYLYNMEDVQEPNEQPKLYYGEIVNSFNAGKKPTNIRMTEIKYSNDKYTDFYFKQQDVMQAEKGIDNNSKSRVILIFGTIETNGSGLCLSNVGWGEFALLPPKYDHLLKNA